ncbi:hypothetical protein E2562_011379 [Oryza meyeriana var. granulata]|uniref:Uncharacterized protein n=1 Tax=Oryza meyeriana var. granulata TaxID=110450 RepID=A0A6G1EA53_9ORYZ|nr:hypothetical protein E2562_011379 [Oryza meyeriana var. granulata]
MYRSKGGLSDLCYRYDTLCDGYEDQGHWIEPLEALLAINRQLLPSMTPFSAAAPPLASAPPPAAMTTVAPTAPGSTTAFSLVWTAGSTSTTLYTFWLGTEASSSLSPFT